ncbi:LURP-one-related/scramblase family protein [Pontibacter akesuensis]|uniref:Uncharacterized protein n=1 Tax=Pontibacter akesuensis TaxID=388950 RepID=A0A1I7J3M7_9BACT|nr:hypothetical protein [Pontibacter akesuensis]SFU79737.1 hypothetical protein SAMN04487941_2462 [Pontibacter akesuensis]
MQNIQFPLTFTFKISTFSNDFVIQDASGDTISFVRQKLFKFIEEVNVYSDESKSEELYSIRANKWLDFSAAYAFTDSSGREVGSVARKGWASLWKARYEIYDAHKNQDLLIQEENGWIKVADGILGEIPILGFFTGYLFNPSYLITRPNGDAVARLEKKPSLFGRRFTVTKIGEFEEGEEERAILSLMMMILLERRRG